MVAANAALADLCYFEAVEGRKVLENFNLKAHAMITSNEHPCQH
jgi:hypothetical protein